MYKQDHLQDRILRFNADDGLHKMARVCLIIKSLRNEISIFWIYEKGKRTFLKLQYNRVLNIKLIVRGAIKFLYFIAGNGPSAIALSYMLAGNTAIYSGISNDEFLHLRLSDMPGYPIVLQDLKGLSEVNILFFITKRMFSTRRVFLY